jgi:xanthine/uracil/vitamin C permease (AzgA family)
VLYPLFKIVAGRTRELSWGTWLLFVISVLFFVFYPYGKV